MLENDGQDAKDASEAKRLVWDDFFGQVIADGLHTTLNLDLGQ
jgi:hypothetical protein